MKTPEISIEFHNPNTDEEAAKYILKIFMEASKIKFENILKSHSAEQNVEK